MFYLLVEVRSSQRALPTQLSQPLERTRIGNPVLECIETIRTFVASTVHRCAVEIRKDPTELDSKNVVTEQLPFSKTRNIESPDLSSRLNQTYVSSLSPIIFKD
jgi:hypothetical protein